MMGACWSSIQVPGLSYSSKFEVLIILLFAATAAGLYRISISIDGYPSFERAQSIIPASIDRSTVEIITASTFIVAGGQGRFDIRVQDMFGNRMCSVRLQCIDPIPPSVFLTNTNGLEISAVPNFNKAQSIFSYSFIATIAGKYGISVEIQDGFVVFNPAPYVLTVPAVSDAGSFLVSMESIYTAGPIILYLQARDKFLNNISTGGDSIQVCQFHSGCRVMYSHSNID